MKRMIYPFILVVLLYNFANAQPTLTASTNNPSVGDVYVFHIVNASNFSPGASGQNVTWDFSSYSSTGTDSIQFVSKSSTSSGSQFTNANMGGLQPSGTESFWLFDNSEFSFCGIYNSSQTQKYTDKREYLQYPVTYNTTHTTSFGGDINASGYQMTRSGSSTTLADGYGDLVMPYGVTMNNILRVRVVGTYSDDWNGSTIANYVDTNYYWFSTTTGQPLVTYNIIYNNGSLMSKAVNYLDQSVVSVEETSGLQLDKIVNVYPNPASDYFNLHNRSDELLSVKIMNSLGQEISSFTLTGKAKKVHSTDHLEKGIYFLNINDENSTVIRTEKVIIQ